MALTKVTGHVVLPTTNIEFHNTKSTGIVTFTHTSNATSSTTGALQVTGGVGIVKDLHVGGNITVGGTLTYDDVTNIDSLGIITARNGIYLDKFIYHLGDLNTSFGFPNDATDTFVVNTSSSEKFRITSDGKIGIGTISPSGLTHWVAPGDMNLYLKSKNSTGTIRWNYEDEVGTVRANHAFVNYGNGKNDFFQWATHDGSSLAERVRITKEGNVGIGSADPGGVLDLYHATSNTILNVKSGDAGSVINLIDNATRSSIEQNGVSLKIISDTVGSYANSDIRFQVDGGTKMMVDHDGYVGIGTNPAKKLEVFDATQGVIRIKAGGGGSNSSRKADLSLFASGSREYVVRADASDAAFKIVDVSGGAERMTIRADGKVGIGTIIPYALLNLYGDSNNGAVSQLLKLGNNSSGAGTGAGIQLGAGVGNAGNSVLLSGFYDGTGTSFTVETCNTFNGAQSEKFRITNDGKVGIATDSPYSNLTVFGENRSDGGTATGQITAKDNAAYNANPTSGIVFQGYFASNNANAVFGGITGFKENATDGNYAGALGFHVRANGAVAYEAVRITGDGQFRSGPEATSNRTSYRHQFSSAANNGDVLSLQNPTNTDGQGIGLGFWARNTNNAAIEVAKIKAVADETQANSTQEGSLRLMTNGGASMGTRIDIDQTTTKVYTDIHVLKGSTAPTASLLLQSHDTANATARIQFLARDNGNVNETCKIQADSSSTAHVDLQFHTGDGEKMRIARHGNVKIGGSGAPSARLHIEDSHNTAYNAAATTSTGQIYVVNTASSSGGSAAGIILQTPSKDNSNVSQATIMAVPEGNTKATMLTFGTRNSSDQNLEQIRIGSNGYIGAYYHGTPQGRFHSGYTINQAARSYANSNEGFILNVDRDHSSGNYQGFVDFVAARSSDNSNGGTRFRFFAQPRNSGINRMIMDLNGTRNHVRMGHSCIYSYGDIGGGEFGSSSFTHYDHKESTNVTHNDFEATRARTSSGGYGANGGIGPKQSTLQQSYATPYKYEIRTPNHESDSANRYYPVSFSPVGRAGGGMIHTMQVARRYHDDGPSDYGGSTIGWTGSSTHQGGLDLFLQVRDSAWSDMYDMRVMHYRYTYHQTVGGWGMFASYSTTYGSGPFYLMLRGGFKYQVYAAHPIAVANVQPGGRVYSTSYAWYWPNSTTSTSGPLNNFSTQYYAGTA